MDVTVAVCTFGDPSWKRLAREHAIPSVDGQAPVIHVHGRTLASTRNAALGRVRSEWIVYLDADDELEPGYIDAMATGSADVRAPAVRYVRNDRAQSPRMPQVYAHHHACSADCLPAGNWIVVGALARTQLLRDVGGWRDFEWSEDWDLWLRCHLAGASIEPVPDAIYRAHVRPDSRNRAPDADFKRRVHDAIYAANFPEAQAA